MWGLNYRSINICQFHIYRFLPIPYRSGIAAKKTIKIFCRGLHTAEEMLYICTIPMF